MKTTLLIILGATMIGCVPKPIDNSLPPPPPKTESTIPKVIKVTDNVGIIEKENIKLNEKIEQQKKLIQDQRVILDSAIKEAEKLKEGLPIDQRENVTKLLENLKTAQTRNLLLEVENENLTKVTKDQDSRLNKIRLEIVNLLTDIKNMEAELVTLRSQYKFAQDTVSQKDKSISQLRTDLEKSKKSEATAQVYRRWIIGIVVAFVLWTIIKNVAMIYLPTAKFRI